LSPVKAGELAANERPKQGFGLATLIQGCLLIIELLNKTRIHWEAWISWREHLRLTGRDQAKAPQQQGGYHGGHRSHPRLIHANEDLDPD
jgi:hypothetical protein